MNTKGRFTFRSVVVLAAFGAAMFFSGPAFAGHESTSGEEPAPKQTQEREFIGPKQDEVLPPAQQDEVLPFENAEDVLPTKDAGQRNEETETKQSKKPKQELPKQKPPKQKDQRTQNNQSDSLLEVIVGHPTPAASLGTDAQGGQIFVARADCRTIQNEQLLAYGGGFRGPGQDIRFSAPMRADGDVAGMNDTPVGWLVVAKTNQINAYAVCGPEPHIHHADGGAGAGHHNVVVIGNNNHVKVHN